MQNFRKEASVSFLAMLALGSDSKSFSFPFSTFQRCNLSFWTSLNCHFLAPPVSTMKVRLDGMRVPVISLRSSEAAPCFVSRSLPHR